MSRKQIGMGIDKVLRKHMPFIVKLYNLNTFILGDVGKNSSTVFVDNDIDGLIDQMPVNFIEIGAIPIVVFKGQTQAFMYNGLVEGTGVAALMSFQEVEKRPTVL